MARLKPDSARGWVAWLSPGLMILVGAVLFFIPAPPTSLVGVGLIVVGAALWLIDYVGGDGRERIAGTGSIEAPGREAEHGEESPPRVS